MSHFYLPPGSHPLLIDHDGRERSAIVYVPRSPRQPTSIVLAFHGAGTCAAEMVKFCGLNEKAEEAGFVVIYPNGTGRLAHALTWNGGPHSGYAGRQQVDDVGFVERLVEFVTVRSGSADALRWYATGMSNGGLLCYRLAEERPEMLLAIAPVASAMGHAECHPRLPVSVIHLHGTCDEFVPYHGGIGKRSLTSTPFVSVPQSVHAWVTANSCHPVPTVTRLPNVVDDGTCVECVEYDGGRLLTKVALYRILGGGHTWPGRPSDLAFLGAATGNLNANDAIWDFFTTAARRV